MTSPIPAGREGVIPHLVCSPCLDAVKFYVKAFGAEEIGTIMAPDGQLVMHAEISIDGKIIFLADDFPEYCGGKSLSPLALGGTPVTIHQYVRDCDAAIEKAVQAGATLQMPASDMFWGDRYGTIIDPFGHTWSFATHVRDLTEAEIQEGMRAAFEQSPPAAT